MKRIWQGMEHSRQSSLFMNDFCLRLLKTVTPRRQKKTGSDLVGRMKWPRKNERKKERNETDFRMGRIYKWSHVMMIMMVSTTRNKTSLSLPSSSKGSGTDKSRARICIGSQYPEPWWATWRGIVQRGRKHLLGLIGLSNLARSSKYCIHRHAYLHDNVRTHSHRQALATHKPDDHSTSCASCTYDQGLGL